MSRKTHAIVNFSAIVDELGKPLVCKHHGEIDALETMRLVSSGEVFCGLCLFDMMRERGALVATVDDNGGVAMSNG